MRNRVREAAARVLLAAAESPTSEAQARELWDAVDEYRTARAVAGLPIAIELGVGSVLAELMPEPGERYAAPARAEHSWDERKRLLVTVGIGAMARPYWDAGGVPYCSQRCPLHDGKRCEVLGARPSSLCEPVVARMAEMLGARDR